MIKLQSLTKKILDGLSFVKNITTIAIYGSAMYKNIEAVRDIDVFVVFTDSDLKSGRIVIYLKDFNKPANIYLIKETDLYDDIHTQKFASKFAVFFFHGYIPLVNGEACYKYYLDSMKSLIKNFDLQLDQNALLFFKQANLKIYKFFPNYLKSGLDFFKCEKLQTINCSLYTKSYNYFLLDNLTYLKNDNQAYIAKLYVSFFRNTTSSSITDIPTKKNQLLKRLADNKALFVAEYGEHEYASLAKFIEDYYYTISNDIDLSEANALPLKHYKSTIL